MFAIQQLEQACDLFYSLEGIGTVIREDCMDNSRWGEETLPFALVCRGSCSWTPRTLLRNKIANV